MKNITRFHAVKMFEWCKKRYGRGYRRYPIIEFRKPNYLNGENNYGEYDYDDDVIFINSQIHKSLEDLANTIIHEYSHYRYHGKREYYQLDKDYEYNNHPMEKQADLIAKRDQKKCVQELKKYYRQFNH